MNIETEIKALHDLAEWVLLRWLHLESPRERRKQQALQLLGEAGELLHNAHANLSLIGQDEEA